MDTTLIEARNSIIKEWGNTTFFLNESKYYYLDNMKDVFAYLMKSNDSDNLIICKYLEAKLAQACYEQAFYMDINKIKKYFQTTFLNLPSSIDGQIVVEFANLLCRNIKSYLKNSILPCPCTAKYFEKVLNSFFTQVKEELTFRPQEHGTYYMNREILNSWIELGIWYNPYAQAVIKVNADGDYIEDTLKSDIREIIFDSYYSCTNTVQRGLVSYICNLYKYDEEQISFEYDIAFINNNSLTGAPEYYDSEEDKERILDFIVLIIRDMVVRECAKSYCLDDIDTFCCPKEDKEDNVIDNSKENSYIKKNIIKIIQCFLNNNHKLEYTDYFRELLAWLNGELSDLERESFAFDLIMEGIDGSHSYITFYLNENEFTISKGGYEKNECGGDSYTDWIWNEPLTEYLESDEIEYRLSAIKEYFSDPEINVSIEE